MPKYKVFVNEVHHACYVVEAEDEEEALLKVVDHAEWEYQSYQDYGYVIKDDAYAELLEETHGAS